MEGGRVVSRRALVGVRPRTENQLWDWLRYVLDVEASRHALVEGSDAPFGYVAHAFFEERGPRDVVVWANRGGGKTFYAAVATVLDLVFKPGIEVRVLAGSVEQGQRMHGHVRRMFEREKLRGLVDGKPTGRRLRLTNGSVVEVSAASESSVRGARPVKMRCDEVELFDPEIWAAAQLGPRSRRCGGVWARASVEALSTMHRAWGLMHEITQDAERRQFRWGVVDVLSRCEETRECSACALWEECGGRAKGERVRGHVGVEDAARMKGRSSEGVWRAEMLCERPRKDGLVFGEFEEREHVFEGSAEGELVCGMDFGFRAPTVVLWARVSGEGVVRVIEERVVSGEVLGEHVRAVVESEHGRPSWVGVDPAGRARNEQTGVSAVGVLRRAGLEVRSRRVGVEAGLRMVRARLRPASGEGARLLVHARCEGLRRAMGTHHYGAARGGDADAAKPVKDGSDHAVDALRYLVVNLDGGEGGGGSIAVLAGSGVEGEEDFGEEVDAGAEGDHGEDDLCGHDGDVSEESGECEVVVGESDGLVGEGDEEGEREEEEPPEIVDGERVEEWSVGEEWVRHGVALVLVVVRAMRRR